TALGAAVALGSSAGRWPRSAAGCRGAAPRLTELRGAKDDADPPCPSSSSTSSPGSAQAPRAGGGAEGTEAAASAELASWLLQGQRPDLAGAPPQLGADGAAAARRPGHLAAAVDAAGAAEGWDSDTELELRLGPLGLPLRSGSAAG
ncbi:unnamed protein product, partial [Prorocentrum cordatum]